MNQQARALRGLFGYALPCNIASINRAMTRCLAMGRVSISLLLNLLLWPGLILRDGGCVGFVIDQRIYRGVEHLRDHRQQWHGNAASSLKSYWPTHHLSCFAQDQSTGSAGKVRQVGLCG